MYRLPSEAEWEYACRGGANPSTPFHTGDTLDFSQANFNRNLGHSCKVGSYKLNTFGLFDMHGNVWEWCADWYEKDYYGKSPRRDPGGPRQGSSWVIRGGCYHGLGQDCRSANRSRNSRGLRGGDLGFRVALVPSR